MPNTFLGKEDLFEIWG